MILVFTLCIGGTSLPSGEPDIVNVTDFGAKPGDGADDTLAVQAAVDACRRKPGTRLVFPEGRYDFFAGADPKHKTTSILVEGCKDLTITGRGAVLVGHGLTRIFVPRRCEGLTIEGFTIDWDRPPFSQGTVIASSRRVFQVRIDEAFPVKGGEPVEAFGEYDLQARRPLRRGLDTYRIVESTDLVEPQVLRVKLSRNVARPLTVGQAVVLRHQVYQYNAFAFSECKDVTLRDVTVYTVPGMGLSAYGCHNMTLDRMRVMIRPGSGRLMSTTADATHFNTCSGTIEIKDCLFEGMGDDAVNIHGMYSVVKERLDDRAVTAQPGRRWAYPPQPGDVLELSRATTMLPYAEARLAAFQADKRNTEPGRLEFAEPLPKDLAVGDLIANLTRSPIVRISGCTVRNNRARGILIQTRDVLIEGNRFEGCSGAGIHVTCDSDYWFESLGTRDVVIRGNVFEDCTYGAASAEAVIRVFAHVPKRTYAPAGVHRRVTIEGNTILKTDNAGIFVASTDGLVVRGNTFEDACRQPNSEAGRSAVYLLNTRNATITGNTVKAAAGSRKPPQALVIGPGCDADSIRVTTNNGLETAPTSERRE